MPDSDEQRQRAAALRDAGMSQRQIGEQLGVSQATVHRLLLASNESTERPRAAAAEDAPGADTEPVSAAELADPYREALAAVPGFPAASAAVQACLTWLRQLREHPGPDALGVTVSRLASELLEGKRPPLGEIGSVALAAEQDAAARTREIEVVVQLRAHLQAELDALVSEGVDHAFGWLDNTLQELVTTARPVASDLGEVRSAEDLLSAPDPGAAVTALRRAQQLGEQCRRLREAQARLLSRAIQSSGGRNIPWSEVMQLVNQHGSSTHGPAPEDYTTALIAFATGQLTPQVPALSVLLDRANPPVEPEPPGERTEIMHHPIDRR